MAHKEIWKTLDCRYEASDLGRIKRVEEKRMDSKGRVRHKKGGLLTPTKRPDGYEVVSLRGYKNNKKQWRVHQLVAIAFHGDYYGELIINHKNGVRADNRAENLEWCTYRENILHSIEVLGKQPSINQEDKNGYSKKIIDVRNGDIFDSLSQVARLGVTPFSYTSLQAMLRGQNPNKTDLRYV
jgi:hypothetical protein